MYIEQYFSTLFLFPALDIEMMYTDFQAEGITPELNERLNKIFKGKDNESLHLLKKKAGIPSGSGLEIVFIVNSFLFITPSYTIISK